MKPDARVIVVEPTRDPDEFAQSLLPVTPLLEISATVAYFRGAATLVPLARMGLFLPKLGRAHVRKPIAEDLFTLNLPLRDFIECRVGGRYERIEPGSAFLAGPGSTVDLRTGAASCTLALNIDAELVRSHWLGPEERPPNGEPCVIPLSNAGGRTLFMALNDAWGEALRGFTSDGGELEDRIAVALAQCLAPELSPRSTRRGGANALERAKAYIRAGLSGRITVPDLARVAGVSNRTLYRLFLDDQGLTPMQFVTAERLSAVRRVLLTADPHELTVTRAAVAHGFGHLGRFSILYRDTFGESPSHTLAH